MLSHKIASLVVVSREIERLTENQRIAFVERRINRKIRRGIDTAFLSSSAATASTPAGILAGVSSVGDGSPATLSGLAEELYASVSNGDSEQPFFVTSGRGALYLASVNEGQTFPHVRVDGTGHIAGVRVLVSPAAGNKLILVDASRIAKWTGTLETSMSREAAIQMVDAASVTQNSQDSHGEQRHQLVSKQLDRRTGHSLHLVDRDGHGSRIVYRIARARREPGLARMWFVRLLHFARQASNRRQRPHPFRPPVIRGRAARLLSRGRAVHFLCSPQVDHLLSLAIEAHTQMTDPEHIAAERTQVDSYLVEHETDFKKSSVTSWTSDSSPKRLAHLQGAPQASRCDRSSTLKLGAAEVFRRSLARHSRAGTPVTRRLTGHEAWRIVAGDGRHRRHTRRRGGRGLHGD